MRTPTIPNQTNLELPGTNHAPLIERLLTPKQLAEFLQVPISWVYEKTRKRSDERLPGFRLDKYWRFRMEDVRAWLETRRRAEE